MAVDSARAPASDSDRPAAGEDWAARATKWVGTGVELIRDKSVRPAYLVAAGIVVVLGVVGSVLASVALLAVAIGRFLDDWLFRDRMWATYLTLGGIFLLLGVLVVLYGDRVTRSEG